MATFETTVIFGEAAAQAYAENGTTDSETLSNIGGSIEAFTFQTQGELDAFRLGLTAMDGYFDYAEVDAGAG